MTALPPSPRRRVLHLLETVENFGLKFLCSPHFRYLDVMLPKPWVQGEGDFARQLQVPAVGRVIFLRDYVAQVYSPCARGRRRSNDKCDDMSDPKDLKARFKADSELRVEDARVDDEHALVKALVQAPRGKETNSGGACPAAR